MWLGLARVTVDKEQIAGTLLEDRLVALRHFVQDQPRYGVLLFNRGLYVDQALAAHAQWPDLDTLLFLVGYDKIVQIFDPRYYDDRDARRSISSFAWRRFSSRRGTTQRQTISPRS